MSSTAPKCECGRPEGQCVKGDLDYCPDVMDAELLDETDCTDYDEDEHL